VQFYFYYIEKAGFIVLFTQEINLHTQYVDKMYGLNYNEEVKCGDALGSTAGMHV